MSEAQITLQGWIGKDPIYEAKDGIGRCRFRVATTPRRFDKETGTWVDGETQWYSVIAWRGLADNCRDSLRRGDPVVVHGRVKAEPWSNRSGLEVTSYDIEAVMIGHDLTRGTSLFTRTPGQSSPVDRSAAEERLAEEKLAEAAA